MSILTSDKQARKDTPIVRGVLDYFPNAIAEVANVSVVGNRQHNPGEPLHWAREKSDDHADSAVRHLIDRGTTDVDGVRHTAKAAWRILALLQLELEADLRAQAEVVFNKVIAEVGDGPTLEAMAELVSPVDEASATEAAAEEYADAQAAEDAMAATLTPEDYYTGDALPGSYSPCDEAATQAHVDEFRTPVFSQNGLLYFIADDGSVDFYDSASPQATPSSGYGLSLRPTSDRIYDSTSFHDLEALYDGVEDGRLTEFNNDNDGNTVTIEPDLDACGTVDGSDPLGYEDDEIDRLLENARFNNLSENGGA